MTDILIRNLKVAFSATEEEICALAIGKAKGVGGIVLRAGLNKRSVDARKKPICFVCSVAVCLENTLSDRALAAIDACRILPAEFSPRHGSEKLSHRPVVVGFGPCGMFSALLLAEEGYRPIVLERGGDIDDRARSVDTFASRQILDTECNVQFGAGGAGTFSDGKCVTRINDGLCRYVLTRLVEFGAPESLLYLAKPHIGTDNLRILVKNIAARILALGGEIRYRTKLLSIIRKDGRVTAVKTDRGIIPCEIVILAIGHSARDTYETLYREGYEMAAKDFSVGVRIEHLQEEIDAAMYGSDADISRIGHAEYTLSRRYGERGVYSFCMCPGGQVMASASEEGGVVTNGMSNFARDGKNANSAIAVSVLKNDYGADPMKAISFQRSIEQAAYLAGGSNYAAPVQTVGDFISRKSGSHFGKVLPTYMNGFVREADLRSVFPDHLCDLLSDGLQAFDRQIRGFCAPYAILTGAETRTSAPLRILRNDAFTAIGCEGLYPGGEGAGYAGGITSAALDGVRIVSAIMEKYAIPGISGE